MSCNFTFKPLKWQCKKGMRFSFNFACYSSCLALSVKSRGMRGEVVEGGWGGFFNGQNPLSVKKEIPKMNASYMTEITCHIRSRLLPSSIH